MNAAIGIGALLLGGWVLNTPTQDLPPDEADKVPYVEVPFYQEKPYLGPFQKSPDPNKALPRDEVKGREQLLNKFGRRGDEEARKAAQAKGLSTTRPPVNPQAAAQKQMAWILPPAPTDPLRANGPAGTPQYPVPPTARDSDLLPPQTPVDPYGSPTAPKLTSLSPSRQSYSPRTAMNAPYYDEANQVRDRVDTAFHNDAYTQAPQPTKAFADARPFSGGGVSPYMNLFRNDTAGGTIDNYSTYVRPALDQRSMNQQFNMDLYGLQRNQRIQNAAMQQLGRAYSRAPQYIGTPQFYQNYGNYYPGTSGQGNYGGGPYGAGGY